MERIGNEDDAHTMTLDINAMLKEAMKEGSVIAKPKEICQPRRLAPDKLSRI